MVLTFKLSRLVIMVLSGHTGWEELSLLTMEFSSETAGKEMVSGFSKGLNTVLLDWP